MDEDFDENEMHDDDKFTEEQILELTNYGFKYQQIQQLERVNKMNVPNFITEIMNNYPALDKDFLIQLLREYECGFEKVKNIFDLMINYEFSREQILQLINLDLDFYNIYDNIRDIITYPREPPEPPELEIRISNGVLIRLLEQGYSFEEIKSLLEYNLIDEDFEWLVDKPYALYEDVYHLLGDGWTFNKIKNEFETMSDDELEDDELEDDELEDDELELGGGKRRRKSRKQCKTRRKKQCKTRRKKQCKTRRKKLCKSRKSKRRKQSKSNKQSKRRKH